MERGWALRFCGRKYRKGGEKSPIHRMWMSDVDSRKHDEDRWMTAKFFLFFFFENIVRYSTYAIFNRPFAASFKRGLVGLNCTLLLCTGCFFTLFSPKSTHSIHFYIPFGHNGYEALGSMVDARLPC